jgi:hypothetical protein
MIILIGHLQQQGRKTLLNFSLDDKFFVFSNNFANLDATTTVFTQESVMAVMLRKE